MSTKTDRREKIRNSKKRKWVKHGIGAHKPSFIHLPSKKTKSKLKRKK